MSAQWSTSGFLGDSDWPFVDEKVSVVSEPLYNRDRIMAEKIVAAIRKANSEHQKLFIYANKVGAHTHYEYTYPQSESYFNPHARFPRWYHIIPAWNLNLLRNSYLNSLRWSVDGFFREFLENLRGADVFILYTSDHGQAAPSRTNPYPHGTIKSPSPDEADVPLMIFPIGRSAVDLASEFSRNKEAQFDRASTFSLFPSLLTLMGYRHADVLRLYGPTLADPPQDSRHFVSGDCFGRAPFEITHFPPRYSVSPHSVAAQRNISR